MYEAVASSDVHTSRCLSLCRLGPALPPSLRRACGDRTAPYGPTTFSAISISGDYDACTVRVHVCGRHTCSSPYI